MHIIAGTKKQISVAFSITNWANPNFVETFLNHAYMTKRIENIRPTTQHQQNKLG